jgi:hypothetical protein
VRLRRLHRRLAVLWLLAMVRRLGLLRVLGLLGLLGLLRVLGLLGLLGLLRVLGLLGLLRVLGLLGLLRVLGLLGLLRVLGLLGLLRLLVLRLRRLCRGRGRDVSRAAIAVPLRVLRDPSKRRTAGRAGVHRPSLARPQGASVHQVSNGTRCRSLR